MEGIRPGARADSNKANCKICIVVKVTKRGCQGVAGIHDNGDAPWRANTHASATTARTVTDLATCDRNRMPATVHIHTKRSC